jgi:hypothetical protein
MTTQKDMKEVYTKALKVTGREYLLDQFMIHFKEYRVISIPDLDRMPMSFMDRLNEDNVTYQFEFIKMEEINFYMITKL